MTLARLSTVAIAAGGLAGLALVTGPNEARSAAEPTLSPAATRLADAEADGPDGEEIFLRECKKCHGKAGKGDTKMGKKYEVPDMTTKEWQDGHSREDVIEVVTKGEDGTKMDPFEDELSKEEIEAVADFVKSLGG